MDFKTIHSYNSLAHEYDEETSDFWDRFPQSFFDAFIQLTKGAVLDIGSGPGREALILQHAGLKVVCIDASQAMIDMTASKGLESHVGDFSNLPFEDSSFDGVWAYTSLLHVPKSEVKKPMQEIMRVLKQNGIFGLGLIEGITEGYRVTEKVTTPRWFSYYTKEQIEELLGQFCFDIVYFEQFKPHTKNYLNYISKKKAS